MGTPRRLAPTWRPGGLGPLLVLGAAALWATTGLWAKVAYQHGVEPLEAASARGAAAFLLLTVWAAARPARFGVPRRDLPLLLGYGVVGLGAFYAVYLSALERLSVSVAAALLYTAPAFTVALAGLLLGERVTRLRLAALVGALVGVLFVTGALGVRAEGIDLSAAAMGLLAGLLYAGYTLFGRAARGRMDAVRALYWPSGFGAAFLALLASPWNAFLDHPGAAPALLGMSIVGTLAPNLLFLIALGRLEAGAAAILATLEPVMAALYGVMLLGETLAPGQTFGIAAIAASAAWLAVNRSKPRPAADAPAAMTTRR